MRRSAALARSSLQQRIEKSSPTVTSFPSYVHVTAPTIHAGFGYDALDPDRPGRPIQLEIFNLARWSVILDVGMPICQLILEEVREIPSISYAGRFNRQAPFLIDDGDPA